LIACVTEDELYYGILVIAFFILELSFSIISFNLAAGNEPCSALDVALDSD